MDGGVWREAEGCDGRMEEWGCREDVCGVCEDGGMMGGEGGGEGGGMQGVVRGWKGMPQVAAALGY